MRRRDVLALAGVVVGAAGVVALGFLLKKFLSNAKVEKFEENLVAKIVENSPIKGVTKAKAKKQKSTKARKQKSKKVAKRNVSKLAAAKGGNASKLLEVMKKGQEYSQVMLEQLSRIPYRSVRRYVDLLVSQKKVAAQGYGKGKRFIKA